MLLRLALATTLLGIALTVRADEPKDEVSAEARVAWLQKHMSPLRSIDPRDEDFSDLEPIRKAIGEARIVQLSEQSHGDGATFHARTRLIKFLHEKCGFDVLAFESGLYDCRRAWELLREGKMPARDAIAQGVFGIWTGVDELQPIFEYLGKQAHGPRPLEICGFDCQFSGPASRTYLPEDLRALFAKLQADKFTAENRDLVLQAFKKLARPGTGIDQREAEAIAAFRKVLVEAKPSEKLGAKDLAFWQEFVDSSLAMADVEAAMKNGDKSERNHINLRDIQMAKNLVWQAREAFPKRKIIVWAAAFHLMRNPRTVAMVVEPGKTPAERRTVMGYAESKITTMGHEAAKDLEKETYSIFFTAAEGEFRTLPMTKAIKLAPVVPGSVEDIFVRAGGENAFVDLRNRGADGRWLEERLVCRVLGNMDYEADWTKVCDGIVFTKKQFAASPAKVDVKCMPTRDPASLGVPWDRYTARDSLDRTITFYLSHPPKDATGPLPIAVFIQGSGCASVFSQRDGKTYGGIQNLLLAAGKGAFRVLVVEKPGVAFGTVPKNPGSSEEGSPEFRREHTLPRWVEAVNAAIVASHRLPDIEWRRTLVVGHSEGGIVAAHVAAANSLVSHVAVLSANGPTQLFDLVELASQPRPGDRLPADAQARVDAIQKGWAGVQADPDSADKMWLGHPHRRWSSFLKTSTIDGLLASRALVFAAHGTLDKAVPVSSFDVLRAELTARGRDLVAQRLEERDHGFRKADDPADDPVGMKDVLGQAASWFAERKSPVEQAVQKDLDRMQGTWRMAAMNQEGESQPLEGPLAKLELMVKGDTRKVQAGETVYNQSTFRINPSASPPTIDVLIVQGVQKEQLLLGVYEVNDDRMRINLASPGRPRPRDFAPKPGTGEVLQELRRGASK